MGCRADLYEIGMWTKLNENWWKKIAFNFFFIFFNVFLFCFEFVRWFEYRIRYKIPDEGMKILLFVNYEHALNLLTQFDLTHKHHLICMSWFEWIVCIICCMYSMIFNVCECYCEWCRDVRKFKVNKTLEIGLENGVFSKMYWVCMK